MTLKNKGFNKTYFVALLFLTISSLLILVWFKDGFFYGGGDVGLPAYNPKRILEITRYIWWEAAAPGFLIPHAITSITPYLFLFLLQLIGIDPVALQAILFFVLLFLMGFGMYLLILSIIGGDKKIYATIGGLFYMFNPYMMVQIWHRFNNTSFFFAASIPFLIIFWRNWIKKGDYLQLLYFLLSGLLASYMFGTLAYVVPFWLILNLLSISEIIFPWENKKHLWKVTKRSLFGFGMWVIFNGWWLIPVITIGSGVTSQQHNIGESLSTLTVISKQAILPYTLQMINSFYIFAQAELGEIYKSFFFRLIPWLGVIVIFYGIIRALLRKHLVVYVIIFVIIIMLSKGSSSPFGQFFLFLFDKFFVLGLLRNPFEKIGILLPLVSGILFTIGIEGCVERFRKYLDSFSTASILIVLFIIMGVYYWPMYTGTVFGTIGRPNYIEIPQSYKDADNWLNERINQNLQTDGKILHLPLTRSDVVTYNWRYGYHGSEPSSLLFTSLPSISHGLNLPRIDDSLTALSLIFHKPYYLHQDKILKLLQDFNVSFIILHKDIEWKGADIYDPQETEKILDNLIFIEKKEQFGDLIIYEILPEYFKPKVILTNAINFVYPQQANMRMWPYLISEDLYDYITPLNNSDVNNIISKSSSAIIFPNLSFTNLEASEKGMDFVANNLARYIFNLTNTRVLANKDDEMDVEKLITQIITSGEDLVNTYLLIKNNNFIQIDSLIRRYSQTSEELFKQDLRKPRLSFYVSPSTINDFFKLQLLMLDQIETKLNPDQKEVIDLAKNKIKRDLNSYKLLPVYPLTKRDNLVIQERQINQFNIPANGKYELLMVDSSIRDIYPDKLDSLAFQINDQLSNFKAAVSGDLISYGERDFNKGEYEVSFNNLTSTNLISPEGLTESDNVTIIDKDTIQLTSDGQRTSYIEGDLGPVSGEDTYQVVFDGSFLSGVEFYVQIIQDGDEVIGGKQKPRVGTFIYRTKQDSNFQNYSFKLSSLNVATRKAKFRIILDPTGRESFSTPFSFGTPTSVSIKNLRVFRVLNNQIFLRRKTAEKDQSLTSGQILKMKQKNPVLYEGKIKIEHPTFLIFKEAFQPGWELELTKNSESYRIDEHYLADLYGNAWWIEKTGEYNFKIEFKPQQKVTWGIYLGLSGLVGVILLHLRSKFKQKYAHN